MKLKFLKDAYYNGQRKYVMGNTYEISDELGEATRWFKRGLVEEVKEEIKKKEEPVIIENEFVEQEILEIKENEEVIVKEDLKKENGKVKRKKGNPLNENPEVL